MVEPSLLYGVAALYLLIAVLYSVLQERNRRLHAAASRPGPVGPPWPSVDIVLPCYNEDPALLAASCASLEAQDYPGELRVFLVDDGSANRDLLRDVHLRYHGRPGWTVTLLERNRGKRWAHDVAIRHGSGELVVTIDSDTVLEPDGIRMLVGALADERIGAATGDVRVTNREQNQLTRLIDERYRLLFRHERAAQSQVGAVLCCSGAFSAYRRSLLDKVWGDYLNQVFLGRRCKTGDDLHLTNLVLGLGFRSRYEPTARASTHVPITLRRYIRQQLRWNQSFYRELGLTLRILRSQHPYVTLDVTARLVQPLLLATVIALALLRTVTTADQPLGALTTGGTVAVAFLGSTASLASKTSRRSRVRFMLLYGLLYVGLLIPTRLWAVTTLYQNAWGTRRPTGRPGWVPAPAIHEVTQPAGQAAV